MNPFHRISEDRALHTQVKQELQLLGFILNVKAGNNLTSMLQHATNRHGKAEVLRFIKSNANWQMLKVKAMNSAILERLFDHTN